MPLKGKEKNQMRYLVPYQKIEIIYERAVHKMSVKKLSQKLGQSYSTALAITQAYQENGRIFKLLPLHSKAFILKHRAHNLTS